MIQNKGEAVDLNVGAERKNETRMMVDVNNHVAYMCANALFFVSAVLLYRVMCGDNGLRYADTPAPNPAIPVINTHTRSTVLSALRSPIVLWQIGQWDVNVLQVKINERSRLVVKIRRTDTS